MKRSILAVLVALVVILGTYPAWGATQVTTALGGVSTSDQVACGGGSAVLLKAPTVPTVDTGRTSITFQNHSNPVVAVYIAPRSDISTSNAGILLDSVHGMSVTLDRSNGGVTWYCITAGGAATVGWTEEK